MHYTDTKFLTLLISTNLPKLFKKLALFFLFFVCQSYFGQELSLQILSENKSENTTIDSIGYQKKHLNVKTIMEEVQKFSDQLLQMGYLENELLDTKKVNDTVFAFNFRLGVPTKFVHIYITKDAEMLGLEKDTTVISIGKTATFLQQKLAELESKGYSLASLRLTDFKKENGKLYALLKMETKKIRLLNEIVINGYEKFPIGHKRNLKRLYNGKVFNKNTLGKIYKDFNNYRFVNQTRYPEILFSEDITKVYVYLEKAKANRFDGYIGFANQEDGKVDFTGYLDLALVNILNAGEAFNLYWKGDDNEQVTFNASIEVPYIFKSPLGVKANLNIFKQDSTFQNTKTAIDLGYYFTYNKKLFLGYQSTESSDIQNTNSSVISDFESSFLTSTFDYRNFIDDALFPEQTRFIFKAGIGERNSKIENNAQSFFELTFSHNLYLNKRNIINIRSQSFYLNSKNFISNELYRFGGIQSIRGFNENSLQANTLTSVLTEYRYVLSSNLYLHSVLDYGFYEDNSTKTKNNLLGLGFGFGIRSKNGLLNLIYANGSTRDQVVKLTNSVVQVKFVTEF